MPKSLKTILLLVVAGGAIGGAILFAPLITTKHEVRSFVREESSYLSRSLYGRRLLRDVNAVLERLPADGEITDVNAENDNGRLTVTFNFVRYIRFGDKIIARVPYDIEVDNIKLLGK